MRFRFCGDADCPDWVLTEMATMARLTSIKMKLLCQHVAKSLAGENLELEQVQKLYKDTKLSQDDGLAAVAALRWLLTSAARHAVAGDDFNNELQQLGLPREHATALVRAYAESVDKITTVLRGQSLRGNKLVSSICRTSQVPGLVFLTLSIAEDDGEPKETTITLTSHQHRMLLADLKKSRSLMEGL